MEAEKVWRPWQAEQEPLRAVGVEAADAVVGPGGGVEFAAPQDLDHAAVALDASAVGGGRTLDHLAQNVVEGAEDLSGRGVVAGLELLGLLVVARRTVLGRHQHRDGEPVVDKGVLVRLVRLVALVAPNGVLGVPAGGPLLDHHRRGRDLMALDAGLALGGKTHDQIGRVLG